MRIALSTGWFFPDSVGGAEVYVAELARELQAAGLWQAAEFAALRRMGAQVVSGRDVGTPRGGECRQAVPLRDRQRESDWYFRLDFFT